MVRSKDPFWDYCEERGHKLYCNFCDEGFSAGITRFECHLSREQENDIKACPQVPDDVQATAVSATHEKYHMWDSNIFDGVALGLLSIAHPDKYLLDYQFLYLLFGGKYAKKAFHWLLFGF
ncbi:hypothetical protein AMTRI_Chr03g144090 [Amborella trichopoda]